MGNIKRNNSRPEDFIKADLVEFLTARGWHVEATHGNVYQTGFPDLYCMHTQWDDRWIDCKVAGRYKFTRAQIIKWPLWELHKGRIWILTAATDEEYAKLFKPPNFRDYWKPSWGKLPNIDDLLRAIDEENNEELLRRQIEEEDNDARRSERNS